LIAGPLECKAGSLRTASWHLARHFSCVMFVCISVCTNHLVNFYEISYWYAIGGFVSLFKNL
jgi:hypothetical protein